MLESDKQNLKPEELGRKMKDLNEEYNDKLND